MEHGDTWVNIRKTILEKEDSYFMSINRYRKYCAAALLVLAITHIQTACADNEPAATPYRPSVSSPANLPEPGWLDVEMGWQRTKGGSDKYRDSFPVAAKLAFNKDWGIVVNSELGVRRTDLDNMQFSGVGDTTFQVKHRIPTADETTAWGISAGFKSPTANDTIGTGKTDYLLTGIYSRDFSDNHLDANLGANHIGGTTSEESRTQYTWAASLSHNLTEQWGVLGELSGNYRRGTATTSQFLTGATYNYNKRVVLDFGAAWGLATAAQDWQLFAGMTILLGQLW
jgi:hypothetical protein